MTACLDALTVRTGQCHKVDRASCLAYHECLVTRDVHPSQVKLAFEVEEGCRKGIRVHGVRDSLPSPANSTTLSLMHVQSCRIVSCMNRPGTAGPHEWGALPEMSEPRHAGVQGKHLSYARLWSDAAYMAIFWWSRRVNCSKMSLSEMPKTRTAPT